MATITHPFYPILYVRGFAGTQGAVEDAVSKPYMGFNEGSTRIRQSWGGQLEKHIFESPLVRLMKEFDYRDVYEAGDMTKERIDARSVVIFRYYDVASEAFGSGESRPITDYARELGELIEQVRDQVCGTSKVQRKKFRVVLVAHSLGGLICRCLLQNPRVGKKATKARVDKVFTYASPHDGIDVRVLGNVPGWMTQDNFDIFNRTNMQKYLALRGGEAANSLGGAFDPQRFFCLVGTNARDYDVAGGWSSKAVGPISDGLVRIGNAHVKGAPRAFVHRSHSGDYGIVNSEEGYQNLVRFLFGDFRADGQLIVKKLGLPAPLRRKASRGKEVRASYHFETVVRVRGARWDLHRRLVSEYSAIHRRDEEIAHGAVARRRHPYLFSTFLGSWARARPRAKDIVFQVDVALRAPEYQVDRSFWPDEHYEGAYIYNDTLTLRVVPPGSPQGSWKLRYGYRSSGPSGAEHDASLTGMKEGGVSFAVPIVQDEDPRLEAELRVKIRPWNRAVQESS